MNNCYFRGNLTKDPEVRTFDSGSRVCRIRIAVDRFRGKGENKVKETAFIDCEAWDTGCDKIAENFKKGDSIFIECSLKQDPFTAKESGEKKVFTYFRIHNFCKVARLNMREELHEEDVPSYEREELVVDDVPF